MSTLITTTAQIGTIKDAGGNNTAMTIDSAGRIKAPQTPLFQATCVTPYAMTCLLYTSPSPRDDR